MMGFSFNVYYASDTGLRRENQDNYLIPGMKIKKLKSNVFHSGKKECRLSPGKPVHVAVSDGMGGEQNGAAASKTVLKALKRHASKVDRSCFINEAVLSIRDSFDNCGATLVSVDFKTDGTSIIAYIEAVGDSPCFLIRNGIVKKATRDDNLYQQLLEENNLPVSEEDLAKAKAGLLEYFGKAVVQVQHYRFFVEPGDIFVLSSDGILLEENDDPFFIGNGVDNPAAELVKASVRESVEDTGNSDNATAVVIEFKKETE